MKKVKVGVIGLGNMGSSHLGNLDKLENADLRAVCDIVKEKADKFAEKYNAKAYYDGFEMIKSGDVEAIVIATPHYDHTPLTIAGFEAGKHVLTEKPIAVHKKDAQKMIDAYAKTSGLKFAAMFNQRTSNAHKKIKELIDNGELGELRRVNWIITDWYRTESYYASGGWRATWKGEGGGVLINQCPHQLDLFQWFFGMPVKVIANCSLGKFHDIEVEDDVTALCEFENGATGVFISTTGEAPGTNRLEVIGENGKLIYEKGQITFTRNEVSVKEHLKTAKEGFGKPPIWNIEIPYPKDTGLTGHAGVLANFMDAILDGKELIAPAQEGIKGLEFGNAMLLSGLKGKQVDIPMDPDEYEALLQKLIAESKNEKKETSESGGDDSFANSF